MISLNIATLDLMEKAKQLCASYPFTLENTPHFPCLYLTEQRLELLIEHCSPLFVDFIHAVVHRRQGTNQKQGLIKACKPARGMKLLDVSAGWGKDAAILASFGADVLMVERQPVMAALLADGLLRLNQESPHQLSLRLVHLDAKDYLQALKKDDYPDVIYIDPMHPERRKSALVKKEMRVLQSLFGPDLDAIELLQLAISRVKKYVVVKWPQRLPPLLKPNYSIPGKTVRFDCFLQLPQ